VVTALVLLLPTIASAKPLYGVQGVSAFDSPEQVTRDLDRIQRAHMSTIRLQAFWAALEPSAKGTYDPQTLAGLDRVIDGAAARKIKVVLYVDGTPCWASSAPADLKGSCARSTPSVYRYPPADPQDFVDISTFLAARYQGKLAAYEIWNEPDHRNELYFAGPDKVQRYVALVKAAYRPLKQVDPKLPVLAGSFVGTNGAWLKAMYAAGVKGNYDGLAVHFYDLPLYGLSNTRSIQRANGDRTPLWLTEYGWSSCYTRGGPAVRLEHACVTAAGQAQNDADTMRAIARTSWVKAAIVYNIRDENKDYKFGLFDARDRIKQAYTKLRKLLRGKLGTLAKPSLRVRAAGGRLVASGSASQIDVYQVTLSQGSTLLYRANLRTDRFGRYKLVLPSTLPTQNVTLRVRSLWSGRSVNVHR